MIYPFFVVLDQRPLSHQPEVNLPLTVAWVGHPVSKHVLICHKWWDPQEILPQTVAIDTRYLSLPNKVVLKGVGSSFPDQFGTVGILQIQCIT